jgi:undecaprenyl-diphosphatase
MTKLQKTELQLMCWIRKAEKESLTSFLLISTQLGSSKGWTIFSLSIIFFVDFSFGCSIGLSSLFGALCAQLLKRKFRRSRPCIHPQSPPALVHIPDPWSFPSGHTCTAFSVASMLWTINSVLSWPFALFALIVGFSRIYLGVHYPTDVLTGAILGITCGITFGTLCQHGDLL